MTAEPTPNHAPDEIKSIPVTLEIVADERPRRGRRQIMNLRMFLEICHGVERGQAITRTCDFAGISYRRFRQYVVGSRRLADRFAQAMEQRQLTRREEALRVIQEAGARGNWMAAAWFLERVWPQEFALRNVSRPEAQEQQSEPEIPAEILAHHRRLMLEMREEGS